MVGHSSRLDFETVIIPFRGACGCHRSCFTFDFLDRSVDHSQINPWMLPGRLRASRRLTLPPKRCCNGQLFTLLHITRSPARCCHSQGVTQGLRKRLSTLLCLQPQLELYSNATMHEAAHSQNKLSCFMRPCTYLQLLSASGWKTVRLSLWVRKHLPTSERAQDNLQ